MNNEGAKATKRERGEGGLIQVGDVWYMLWRHHGRQFRKSTGETVKQKALRKLNKKIQELRDGGPVVPDPDRLHFSDLRALYVQDYIDQERKSQRRNAETGEMYFASSLKHLDEYFDGWKISEITTEAINQFKSARQTAGAANGTINRSLAALRRMFKLATEQSKIKYSPVIKMLFEPKNTSPRQGFLEVSDYQKLFDTLPPYIQPLLAMGFYTGMRLGEIIGLRWHQVKLSDHESESRIELAAEDTKNSEPRIVPLIDGLPESLENIRRKNPDATGSDFVFRTAAGNPIQSASSFIKPWRTACIKAAVRTKLDGREVVSHFSKGSECCPYCEAEHIEKGTYVGFLFHDLRRSAVRNLTQAGVPRSLAMRISGHRTESVFERYNITTTHDVQNAGVQVEKYLDQQRKLAAAAPKPKKLRVVQG
jgi:integrase